MRVVMAVTTQPCMFCGASSTIEVEPAAYARWLGGEHVQDVFPQWTPGQRELLITGTHPKCWDDNFGEPE